MKVSSSFFVIAFCAALLVGSLAVSAFAATEKGPLLVTAATSTYALEGVNTTGAGVVGESTLNGNGVWGVSKGNGKGVYGQAKGASGIGVVGQGNSYGVQGISGPDGFGVVGQTGANGVAGVFGSVPSGSGYGVEGQNLANNGIGVYGKAGTLGYGVEGIAGAGGSGVYGTTGTYDGKGVYGSAAGPTSIGVYGSATSGGTGLSGYSATLAMQLSTLSGGLAMQADNENGHFMSLDGAGNMILAGTLTQNGTPAIVVRGRDGKRTSYASQSTVPAIEDTGEAQLRGGAAFVALDPALAASIDASAPYHVLLTPEGECRGLYVASKTSRGFTVREMMYGRSGIAFEYRIVARPAAAQGTRLALYTAPQRRR